MRRDLEFAHDRGPMRFHCLHTDVEKRSNLPVCIPFCNQLEDGSLPIREGHLLGGAAKGWTAKAYQRP